MYPVQSKVITSLPTCGALGFFVIETEDISIHPKVRGYLIHKNSGLLGAGGKKRLVKIVLGLQYIIK